MRYSPASQVRRVQGRVPHQVCLGISLGVGLCRVASCPSIGEGGPDGMYEPLARREAFRAGARTVRRSGHGAGCPQ